MMRYFVVLFVLVAIHTIDAREPWPPKDGLGKDLPQRNCLRHTGSPRMATLKSSLIPMEVERLFYDFDVRIKFWFMVGRMIEIAKRGERQSFTRGSGEVKGCSAEIFPIPSFQPQLLPGCQL